VQGVQQQHQVQAQIIHRVQRFLKFGSHSQRIASHLGWITRQKALLHSPAQDFLMATFMQTDPPPKTQKIAWGESQSD